MRDIGYHYVCINIIHESIWIEIDLYKKEKKENG